MQNIFSFIFNEIKHIAALFLYYSRKWYYCFNGNKTIQNNIEVDKVAEYIGKHKRRFADSFINSECNFNTNISEHFYTCDRYKEMVETVNHPTELLWKKNILMDCTPYGNVIMHYDVFKNGFAYYSDINLSYKIINATAMKYVLTFFCRDFFMDEQCLPEHHRELTVLKIINDAEKQREKELKEVKKEEGDEDFREFYRKMIENKNTPFLKPKTKNVEKNTAKEKPKEYNSNRFIYLGKITNCQFLQRPSKKVVINEDLSSVVNILDYKKWKENNKI
jgi:hypothetical protein